MRARRHSKATAVSGAVLAGGGAARYGGVPKGLLPLRSGTTIIAREIAELRAGGIDDVVIVANDPQPYASAGLRVIPDLRPGKGPLAGIEAALADRARRSEAVLFLPCDLPGITAAVISKLIQAFVDSPALAAVAVTERFFWQPLCTVVHNAAAPAVSRALDAGRLRVRGLWEALDALPVHFDDPAPFFNVNTPEDLARWQTQTEQTTWKPV